MYMMRSFFFKEYVGRSCIRELWKLTTYTTNESYSLAMIHHRAILHSKRIHS